MTATKTQTTVYDALRQLVNSRPGFDPRNYATWSDYQKDARESQADRRAALALLDYCESMGIDLAPSVDGRGRVTVENGTAHYCAGQYYCVEYRAAVARVCASAIWYHLHRNGYETREKIQRFARNRWGRKIAREFFN